MTGRTHRAVLRFAIALTLAAAVVATAAACGSATQPTSSPSGSPRPGGTFTIPLGSDPVSIVPYNVTDSDSGQVAHQIFEGLVKYELQADGSMKAVPDIAESWSANADLTVWTFELRRGVTFQPPVDREVTAADFVADMEFATDPANQSYTSYVLAPLKGVEDSGYASHGAIGVKALGRYTLRITLRYPFAEFPLTLGTLVTAAWPVDYLREVGRKAFAEKPVGTGPFLLDKWSHSQAVDLVRNPTWWNAAAGGPYLDRVHMPIVPNTNTMWMAFQKGDLDYTLVPTGQQQSSRRLPQVVGGAWTARVWPLLTIEYIGMNMKDARLTGSANLALRQALSYAIDQRTIIRVVDEGGAQVPNGLVPFGVPGADLSSLPYATDAEKAKALVQGIGELPTLDYWYNTQEELQKLAEAYQAAWTAAGLDVRLSDFEFGTFADKVYVQGAAQLFRGGWGADYPSMDNFLYPLFESSQSQYGSGTAYANPEVDRLLHEARRTADEGQRLQLYAEAERMILQDAPVIPVAFGGGYRITNNRIGGFAYDPLSRIDMWKLWVR